VTTTGEAVLTVSYWVVVRLLDRRGRYVVVDTSVAPPVQVFGPTTRREAEAHARVQAGLFSAVYGQTLP
jgi:hypothetical protein